MREKNIETTEVLETRIRRQRLAPTNQFFNEEWSTTTSNSSAMEPNQGDRIQVIQNPNVWRSIKCNAKKKKTINQYGILGATKDEDQISAREKLTNHSQMIADQNCEIFTRGTCDRICNTNYLICVTG